MKEVTRTVQVNNRPYILTVESEQEEIVLNKSIELIHNEMNVIKNQVKINDRVDALAMVAIDLAAEKIRKKEEHTFVDEHLTKRLENIDKLLDDNM